MKVKYRLSVLDENDNDSPLARDVEVCGLSWEEVREDIDACWSDGWLPLSCWYWCDDGWTKHLRGARDGEWRVMLKVSEEEVA